MSTSDVMTKAGKEAALYLKLAEAAKAQREASGDIGVLASRTVPQKDIINRLAASTGGQDKELHFMFGDRTKSLDYANQEYKPAIDPATGEWVKCEGDPCWCIDAKLYKARLDAQALRSTEILTRSHIKHEMDESKKNPVVSEDSVKGGTIQVPDLRRKSE